MNIASDVISDITSSFRHDISADVLGHVSEWVRDFYAMDSSVLTGDINEKYDMLDSLGRSYLQGYISGLNHEFSTRTVIDEDSDGAKSQTFAKFRARYGDTYPSFLLALVAQFIDKQTPSDYETPVRQVTVNEDGDEIVYENDVESGKRILFQMAVAFADGLCDGIDKNRKLTHGYVKVIDDTLSHSLSYQAGREVSMSVTRWKPDSGEVDPFGTEITISDVIMGLFDNTRDLADDDDAKDDCADVDVTSAASRSSLDGDDDDGGSDAEAQGESTFDATERTGGLTDDDDSSQLQLNLSTDEIVDICDDDWVTYGYDVAKDSVRQATSIVRAAYSFDDDETLDAIAALCLRKTVSVCFEYIAQRTRRYYDEDETAQRMMLVGYSCSYMGQAIDELRGEHLLFESGEVELPKFDLTPFPQSTLDMVREYKFKYDYPEWIYDCARASMSAALDEVLDESTDDVDDNIAGDEDNTPIYLIPADSDYYMMVAFGSMDGIFDMWCETAFKSDNKKRPIYDILGAPMPDDEKEAQREQMREHMRNRERMRRIREARRERRKRTVKETGTTHKISFAGNEQIKCSDAIDASERTEENPRRKRMRSLKPKRNGDGGHTDDNK